jgi:hypothetical protein
MLVCDTPAVHRRLTRKGGGNVRMRPFVGVAYYVSDSLSPPNGEEGWGEG